MYKLLCFVAVLFGSITSHAQWESLSIGRPDSKLITTLSDNRVVFVKGYNYIYTSDDAGANWDSVVTGYDSEIWEDMQFVNDTLGYICGGGWFSMHRNIVMRTTDGGTTWQTLTQDSLGAYKFLFTNIAFVSIDSGFVSEYTGNLLYQTLDGGISWLPTYIGNENAISILDLQFINNKIGFASTSANIREGITSKLYKTIDFGATWQLVLEGTTNIDFLKMQFLNDQVGYVGASTGLLYITKDGGANWQVDTIAGGQNITALHFINEQIGYINNANGVLYTHNGGMSWIQQVLNPAGTVTAISNAPSGNSGFLLTTENVYKRNNNSTSIEPLGNKETIILFPNPAKDVVFLKYPNHLKISSIVIYDALGRMVRVQDNNLKSIDISSLPVGKYQVQILNGKQVYHATLVVQ